MFAAGIAVESYPSAKKKLSFLNSVQFVAESKNLAKLLADICDDKCDIIVIVILNLTETSCANNSIHLYTISSDT